MRNDNGKNPNTQLPNQVAAVEEFQKLIADYFQVNSLANINRILIEMISAAIGPDSSTGKHAPIDISNTLYYIRNTINLIAKNERFGKSRIAATLCRQTYLSNLLC